MRKTHAIKTFIKLAPPLTQQPRHTVSNVPFCYFNQINAILTETERENDVQKEILRPGRDLCGLHADRGAHLLQNRGAMGNRTKGSGKGGKEGNRR